MNKLVKTLFTVLIASFMVLTNLVSSVSAFSDDDKAIVTVEGLEAGDTVTLYKVVKATYDNGQHTGYEPTTDKIVSVKKEVTLTEKNPSGDPRKLTVTANELDVDKDGKADAEYTKDGVTYTVPADVAGDILYNWEQPTQEQIFLVRAEEAWTTTGYTETVENGKNYVQIPVEAGQYIGVITPAGEETYNPVVLSAGITGEPIYALANTGASETADSYKLKNGDFSQEAPTATTYHLYENAKLNDAGEVVFENDFSLTGKPGTPDEFTVSGTAGDPYRMLYKKDDTTTENRLIADDIFIGEGQHDHYYAWKGTTAAPKKAKPDVKKELKTDYEETNKMIPVVAVDEKGNPVNADAATNSLTYISKNFTKDDYMKVLNASSDAKFVVDDTTTPYTVTEDASGTARADVLTSMRTTDIDDALHVEAAKVYNAGQGELAHYTLTPTIPQYPANSINKTLILADKMAEGLDYVEGSLDITIEGYEVKKEQDIVAGTANGFNYYVFEQSGTWTTETDPHSTKDGEGTWYKDGSGNWHEVSGTTEPANETPMFTKKLFAVLKEGTGVVDGKNDFQINFVYDNLPGTEGDKKSPVVKYDAVITKDAVAGIEGNINVVKFFYAKDSYQGNTWETFNEPSGDDYTRREDAKKVYTYELRFRKANDKPEYLEVTEGDTHVILKTRADALATTESQAAKDAINAFYDSLGTLNDATVKLSSGEEVRQVIEKAALPTETVDGVVLSTAVSDKKAKKNEGDEGFKTLAGAIYGVYSDAAATKLVTTVETNANGIGITTNVHNGEYWVKELVAPTGYTVDTTVYGPFDANWTSATTTTTETTERWVYTVKPTEAINENNQNAGQKAAGTSGILENVWSSDGTTAGIKDNAEPVPYQVGWLIGDGPDAPFYELKAFDPSEWHYVEYVNNNGEVLHHFMEHNTDGTLITNVYRAYLKEKTTTSTSGTATVYNNNGGIYYFRTFKDTTSSTLPSTGGIGTYAFTVAGVAILALASFMLLKRQHSNN